MKFFLSTFLFALIPIASFSETYRPGLLTKNYGIVTKQDLDEDEKQCTEVEPFPPKSSCMMYWQCLPTRGAKITCNSLGPDNSDLTEEHGEFILSLKDSGEVHEYFSRHNNDMAYCRTIKKVMLKIMAHEKIVCVSGEFGGKEGRNFKWIIDRMKSYRGEWSWFQRNNRGGKR